MGTDEIANIITSEIDARFSDIGDLVEDAVDFHFGVIDGKIPGNKMRSGDVYCVERYLRDTQNEDFHLRFVRKVVGAYIETKKDTYQSALRSDWKLGLGYLAIGAAAMTIVDDYGMEAAFITLGVLSVGVFYLVFSRSKKWREGYIDIHMTKVMIENGDLDAPLVRALTDRRESLITKFGERRG